MFKAVTREKRSSLTVRLSIHFSLLIVALTIVMPGLSTNSEVMQHDGSLQHIIPKYASTRAEAIFIGFVENMSNGHINVKVKDVLRSSIPLADLVSVFFDQSLPNIDLGLVLPGDEILVVGSFSGDSIVVNSNEHYMLNLAYQGSKETASFLLKRVREHHFEKELSLSIPISTTNIIIKGYAEATISFETSFNLEVTRLGLGRPGALSVYILSLSPGLERLKISLDIEVNVPDYMIGLFEIDLRREYDIPLHIGRNSSIELGTFKLFERSIGIANIRVELAPVLTFIPTGFSCFLETPGSVITYGKDHVNWRSHENNIIILTHINDEGQLKLTECKLYTKTVRLSIRFYVRWRTPLDYADKEISYEVPVFDFPSEERDLGELVFHSQSKRLITITSPGLMIPIYIKINNEIFLVNGTYPIRLAYPRDRYVISVPRKISVSLFESYIFRGWSNGGGSSRIVIELVDNIELIPIYEKTWNLGVFSIMGIICATCVLTTISLLKRKLVKRTTTRSPE